MKDLFEDVRAVAEPSGALALAGMKKYIAQHNIRGERLAHILSGANVNFHGLRYVSEPVSYTHLKPSSASSLAKPKINGAG